MICASPSRMTGNDGSVRLLPCRKCKKCIADRVTDLNGRAYAEALVSDLFVALTLTYAGEGPNSQTLVYADIQRCIKRVRRAGVRCRYIVAGEYGAKRGRAHWHAVFFFRGSKEELERALELPPAEKQCQHWRFWPHGFTFVQRPDYHGLLYVTKYAVKDDGSGHTTRSVMMSKKPPLGADYWPRMARRRIAEGLPFRRAFTLPEARYRNGNPVQFFLRGASLELAWYAHVAEWRALGRADLPPIYDEDYEAVTRKLAGPAAATLHLAEPARIWSMGDGNPWFRHSKFRRAIWVRDGYIVSLTDGTAFYCGVWEGRPRAWRLKSLAEMVATARGRRVSCPQVVGRWEVPF